LFSLKTTFPDFENFSISFLKFWQIHVLETLVLKFQLFTNSELNIFEICPSPFVMVIEHPWGKLLLENPWQIVVELVILGQHLQFFPVFVFKVKSAEPFGIFEKCDLVFYQNRSLVLFLLEEIVDIPHVKIVLALRVFAK